MTFTRDSSGRALLGGVVLEQLLADGLPTPAYVYDVDAIAGEADELASSFGGRAHLICFAVKANTAGRIVRRLAGRGVGADVVSLGEMRVALGAGVPPERIVWSGVAKRDDELDAAISAGDRGLLSIHVESIEELERIDARAKALSRRARVSIRVNPSVEADTHAHIATGHDEAKFGVEARRIGEALGVIERCSQVELVGLSAHVGSQMTTTGAYLAGVDALCQLATESMGRGHRLELLDLGGGFGVDYGEGCPARPADFIRQACERVEKAALPPMLLLCEPGRSLVAAHGVLLARAIQTKRWSRPDSVGWLFLDAGMNDLIRPALYGARHRIEPLHLSPGAVLAPWRLAGPVCESSDDFGTFLLPDPPPNAVALREAGAYGYVMACRYNGRAMPVEAFIEGGRLAAVSRCDDVDAWVAGRLGVLTPGPSPEIPERGGLQRPAFRRSGGRPASRGASGVPGRPVFRGLPAFRGFRGAEVAGRGVSGAGPSAPGKRAGG